MSIRGLGQSTGGDRTGSSPSCPPIRPAGNGGPTTVGSGGHRVEVPNLLTVEGLAQRARLVQDHAQTLDPVDRGRYLGADPRGRPGRRRRGGTRGLDGVGGLHCLPNRRDSPRSHGAQARRTAPEDQRTRWALVHAAIRRELAVHSPCTGMPRLVGGGQPGQFRRGTEGRSPLGEGLHRASAERSSP